MASGKNKKAVSASGAPPTAVNPAAHRATQDAGRHPPRRAAEPSQACTLEVSETSRRAEQRYRAFLNFLPDPVFVFNLDSTVSYLNPAFESVFGWTLGELQGKIIPFVPKDCKSQTREGLDRLYREKIIHNFETKRLTKDGRLLDIIIDGAIFYDKNNHGLLSEPCF